MLQNQCLQAPAHLLQQAQQLLPQPPQPAPQQLPQQQPQLAQLQVSTAFADRFTVFQSGSAILLGHGSPSGNPDRMSLWRHLPLGSLEFKACHEDHTEPQR